MFNILTYLSASSVTRDKRVYDKAVDYLYQNLPTTMAAQTIIPVFIYAVLWSSIDHLVLTIWTAVNFLICFIDYVLYSNYKKKRDVISEPQKWGAYYALNSLAMGLLNGLAVFLFFSPDSVGIQSFLITIILGYSAGAIVMNSYWLPSSYLLATPVLLLAASRFFIEGGVQNTGVSILLLIYLATVILYSKNIFDSVLGTIKLQFEISDLSKKFEAQKEVAEKANIAKSKFLAAASHDLRQPLHAMGLFANLLDKELETKTQKQLFNQVTHSLDALKDLLNTLLDVSKLDAGVVEKNLKHFPLRKTLDRLSAAFTPEAREKDLTLNLIQNDIVVYSNPALLELILRNLMSNAFRYTEQGSITLKIEETNGNTVKISVIDTGIGIPKDRQEEIFLEFHQLSNPERDRSKGMGLGLSIVKRLLNLLNYSIEIESSPGCGSTFSIFVPLGDKNKVFDENIIETCINNTSIAGAAILFIDDELQIRQGMKESLEKWECNVLAVASAEEAVTRIKQQDFRPEVIITDYRLRENKTGAEAIQRIRSELDQPVPALIITGDTAPERLREARASGHVLLHKPVQAAQILAFIRRTVKPTFTDGEN